MKVDASAVQELLDREAIRDCLMRYAHAVDRGDEAMLRDVYWPDATDDHGIVIGSAADFIAWVIPFRRATRRSLHMIANIMIRLDGAVARVESYFLALHTFDDPQGVPYDLSLAGRYLDRMEKRDGAWRIQARSVAFDWYRQYPDSREWSEGPVGPNGRYGTLGREDPVYRLFTER
jgi:hypothetical protein